MKKYIQTSPTETMLIELSMGEYNKIVQLAKEQMQKRLAAVVEAHPESKSYNIEVSDGQVCLVYEAPEEPSVPPESKPRKVKKNVL